MTPLRRLYAGLLWAGDLFAGLVLRVGGEPGPPAPTHAALRWARPAAGARWGRPAPAARWRRPGSPP